MPRLCVIGLDCVAPELWFGPWLADMPNVRRLLAGGFSARMVSTIPPITVPAWMCMMTSQDPGMLGIYGFRNRASRNYEDMFIANGRYIQHAHPLWYHLSRNDLRSIVIGVPLTYPPTPLRGVMASGFLAPNKETAWTFPRSLASRLDQWAGGDFILDIPEFRSTHRKEILEQIYRMTEGRFAAFRRLLSVEPWDFAILVDMGPDRLHHVFWRYHDPSHRLHEPGHEFADAIRRYYLHLDREIGQVLDALPPDTSVIVVSDHGAKAMRGAFCINEWLIREGLLVLQSPARAPTRFTPAMVDWDRTRVWGDGGYYARIHLNVEGREPRGVIPASELEAFKHDLKARLEATTDPEGRPLGTRVFYPEEVYRQVRGIAPDLIAYLGDLDWRSVNTVGGEVHQFENDTGPDDANHAQEGIFMWQGRGKAPARAADRISIYDIAPSILDFFGVGVPQDMIGTVI